MDGQRGGKKIVLKQEPIHKILIANRGDIALRIQKAAHKLRIPVAVVYSEKETGSFWLRGFTEKYSLGDGPFSDTYLNISRIIDLALRSGADAIHPGYGLLSENHLLAKACEENDIRFIGPAAQVLKLMGDKLASHEFVASLGVPVIDKIINTPHEIDRQKHTLEYPVLVKAAAGGGGKGMRLVHSQHELTDVLEITAHEAFRYFADERVFIEKYLHSPRHIEVQILADHHGNVVHLFERECSIQRRHQKILEETRAIAVPEKVRKKIIHAALTIAQSVGYKNAGTIEFLLDHSGEFFFLEMNPRIQVEHGITEMITGIDLVKEQIRIAEGYPLSFSQKAIRSHGHAIEARIFAEDPENDLMPSPGQIHYYKEAAVTNVRTDSSVTAGSFIFPDFDPLIARIISWGNDREEAISGMLEAVSQMVITGVRHNLSLVKALLSDEKYRNNEISTTLLQERYSDFRSAIGTARTVPAKDILIASVLLILSKQGRKHENVWQSIGYWRNVPRLRLKYDNGCHEMDYRLNSNGVAAVWYEDHPFATGETRITEYDITFMVDHVPVHFYYDSDDQGNIVLTSGGLDYAVQRMDRIRISDVDLTDEEDLSPEGIVRSPLPGKVSNIYVEEGDNVEKGDFLISIESMKLENGILATRSGVVVQVLPKKGDQVKMHDPLIYIK
jgi:3-methylcrotonyl-CoA carboxylase alpha subunit